MKIHEASKMYNAIARTRGPRLDYRTEEARTYTAWMDKYVRPYLSPGCSLLDVGCGSGKQTFKAESLGARATGMDCAEEMIRLAKEIARESKSATRFVLADYTRVPFGDRSFDLALFPKNTIECSYTEASCLATELKRTLKPGGLLLLTVRDAFLYSQGSQKKASHPYDVITGREGGTSVIPGQGEFEYPSYFWTVAFAVFVFGQHLHFKESHETAPYTYQLVFESTQV